MLDIHELMRALAARRPVFHSESDFQFALAWQIREETGHDVRLEFPPFPDERIRLDVWVPNGGLAIELKYSTRKLKANVGGEGFALSDQAAGDLCHYDFLTDVTRLERVTTDSADACGGVAVLLTNDWLHWKPPEPPDTAIGAEFRVHQGRRLPGRMSWSSRAGPGSTKGRESPIELSGSYRCHWRDYGRLLSPNQPKGARFRYLAIEIRR